MFIVIVARLATAGLRGLATETWRSILGLGDFPDSRILGCIVHISISLIPGIGPTNSVFIKKFPRFPFLFLDDVGSVMILQGSIACVTLVIGSIVVITIWFI